MGDFDGSLVCLSAVFDSYVLGFSRNQLDGRTKFTQKIGVMVDEI